LGDFDHQEAAVTDQDITPGQVPINLMSISTSCAAPRRR